VGARLSPDIPSATVQSLAMKKFFGRRPDRDLPPTTQEPPLAVLPPLEFATPALPGSNAYYYPHPPKPTNFHVAAPPVQRYREKHKSAHDRWDDKPLPNPARIPRQKAIVPVLGELLMPEVPTTEADFGPPLRMPQTSIPEFRNRRDLPRNTGPAPVFLDSSPTLTGSEVLTRNQLHRTPIPGPPDRKPSTNPIPPPKPLPSELLTLQNPRMKHSSLEPANAHANTHDTSYTTTSLSEIGTPPLSRLRRSRAKC